MNEHVEGPGVRQAHAMGQECIQALDPMILVFGRPLEFLEVTEAKFYL